MPLELYERNGIWWVRGRVHFNGRPITAYVRRSTGATTKAGARDWIRRAEDRAIRSHLVGTENALTFEEAVLLYHAKPAEARYLLKILPHLKDRACASITPAEVRQLGPAIYPTAATDTWRRQVIAPVSAVINNAHDLGRCPSIRIRGYSTRERMEQDKKRGKESRVERAAADWPWVRAFQSAADPYNAALVQFMFETAARVGQAVAITPRDLDLQNARVHMPASKGHPRQWVPISMELVVMLANLPPKRPHDRRTDRRLQARVFGYSTHSGMLKRWRAICEAAGIEYLSPHSAGRHGFYTQMRVRQGIDPVAAARWGRWASHVMPEIFYAHTDADEAAQRAAIRANPVHTDSAAQNNSRKS